MNSESFEKLRDWVNAHRDVVRVGKPAAENVIMDAEQFLQVKFPGSYVQFLKTWGTLALGPCEFYGIAGTSFDKGTVPNGIWFTQVKRKQVALPNHLIVLYDNNGDEYYCIDTFADGRIVTWDVVAREVTNTKSADLFAFILDECKEFVE